MTMTPNFITILDLCPNLDIIWVLECTYFQNIIFIPQSKKAGSILLCGILLEYQEGICSNHDSFLLSFCLILSYPRLRFYLSVVTSLFFFHCYDSFMIPFDLSLSNLVIL